MSICQGLSSDNGEDVAQVTLIRHSMEETSDSTDSHSFPDERHPVGLSGRQQPMSVIISGENSPAKKRERDGADDSEGDNR